MSETLTLAAKKRDILGKAVRKIRNAGALPAVLYGRGIPSTALEVSASEFLRIFREAGENTVLKLAITDGGREDVRNVLIHDVSRDPLSGMPIHVDFYQVRMDEKVKVAVPLEFVGESPAVKNEGGVLVKSLQELEVEALPAHIPETIRVDIAPLATFDDAIYVRDLAIPPGVEVKVPADTAVASVQPPRGEEELKALEEAPTAAAPEVVTEAEAKKKEEEAQAAAEAVEEPPASS